MPGIEEDEQPMVLGGWLGDAWNATKNFFGFGSNDANGGTNAGGTSTTPVTIGVTDNSGPTWNANGAFDWRVGFSTSGTSGWIVQEIINTIQAENASGVINTSSVVPHYWEAWAVDGSSTITPNVGPNHDYWIRPGRGANSKGSWSMTGRLHFTTTDPATQGFTPGGVSNAGILLSSTTAPTGLGAVLRNRSANGTWDSMNATPVSHSGATS